MAKYRPSGDGVTHNTLPVCPVYFMFDTASVEGVIVWMSAIPPAMIALPLGRSVAE